MVVGAVGIAGAAYAVYWFFDTVYDIGEKAKDAGKDAYDAYTMPGEVQPQVSIVKSIFKSLGILWQLEDTFSLVTSRRPQTPRIAKDAKAKCNHYS